MPDRARHDGTVAGQIVLFVYHVTAQTGTGFKSQKPFDRLGALSLLLRTSPGAIIRRRPHESRPDPAFRPVFNARRPSEHLSPRHARGPRAPEGGSPARRRRGAHREPAPARQADRARTHRAAARRRLLRGVRHPEDRPRRLHGPGAPLPRRRGHHRPRHDRRPRGLSLQPGLHRDRRLARRGPLPEDQQGHGPRRARGLADHRPERLRRGAHPGGGRRARRLRRDLQPQRAGERGGAADLLHHGPLRRRGRLQPGHHRLRLHGRGHLLHVRDRAERGPDGHPPGDLLGRPRRRARPRRTQRGRPLHGAATTSSACARCGG